MPFLLLLVAGAVNAFAQTAITTHRYNAGRTAVNATEEILNHENVAKNFGKLFELPVAGEVYAQPLYVPALTLADGSKHNVVFVAALDSFLYAFDADTAPSKKKPYLWRTYLGSQHKSVMHQAPIPWQGILSTPVIDIANGVIYASCLTADGHEPAFKLYKVALKDGAILNTVKVEGSLPGTGADAVTVNGESRVPFSAKMHLQRPGLLLHKGFVHLAFASHGDEGPFHGWIFSFRADDLKGGPSFLTSPHGMTDMIGAGIWQSGMGMTVDDQGYVYASTGNGDFSPEKENWGNSMLKLDFNPVTGMFTRLDFFTPYNLVELNALDLDVGSAGVLFVPPRFLIGAGKSGKFYILDRDNMGGYTPEKNGDVGAIQVMQVTDIAFDKIIDGEFMWNIHGAPVFWNNHVYVMGESDPVKSYRMDLVTGRLDPAPVSKSTFVGPVGMPGGFVTISVNAKQSPDSAIVWVIHHLEGNAVEEYRPGRLYALDANDLSRVLWSSDLKTGDKLGTFAKFVPPAVADGKVFQATFDKKVVVYGLKK